ncbi:hypothetical protein KPL71_009410 [Citrus sinensis]|uniref:Uncharacterized protein n=1 Tax=Citrus sinensis TaxID=2711 RepID=A0ACB8ME06_CITSI|nr:hypothetical protein KPL71_009410 [Citrus sinensis]
MPTNKERIERVEAEIGSMQDSMKWMELGINDKLHHLEGVISKLADSIGTSKGAGGQHEHAGSSRPSREENERGRQPFPSRAAKLEFLHYSGDDPTEWFNQVTQFFYYQETLDDQRVVLASFHLEGEANQWWQWLRRAYQEEGRLVTWETFEEELWARFGPTESEDFDEALSRVKQTGSLREYQKEFKRLGNRSCTINIASHQQKHISHALQEIDMGGDAMPASARLMFQLQPKFKAGHKCSKAQLLFLESEAAPRETVEDINEEIIRGVDQEETIDPKITFYALTGGVAPQTMRVMAMIESYEIIVLIDNGSTHNFISTRLANLLLLPIKLTAAFSVRVANREKLTCQGKFEKEPTQLPSKRDIDHCITLKKGIEPVNVRPYRYAYFQKAEIEKQVDEKKIAAMVSWPKPQTITKLRGFLGLTRYYRKLVQGYGVMARPLTNLLKKGQFGWNEEAEGAFNKLKQAMTSTPTLAMPNFRDTFIIKTDAFREGIGAVLQQKRKSIAFMSRTLGRSLKYFFQRVTTPEQQKWLAKLIGYEYEILYRPGRDNAAVDALSRRPDSPTLNYLFVPQVALWEEIKSAAKEDEYMRKIARIAQNQAAGPYSSRNGLMFFKGNVVVPHKIRETLLFEAHNTRVGGHFGVLRTYKCLAQQFYWPSMFHSVQEYVGKCETCQRTKSTTLKPAGLLQPLSIPCQAGCVAIATRLELAPRVGAGCALLVACGMLSALRALAGLRYIAGACVAGGTDCAARAGCWICAHGLLLAGRGMLVLHCVVRGCCCCVVCVARTVAAAAAWLRLLVAAGENDNQQ